MGQEVIVKLLEEHLPELHIEELLKGSVGKNANAAAVIVAGGSGERFGNPGGKQLFPLLGIPLMTWSLLSFDAVPEIGHIVIVCPEDRIEEYTRIAIDPYEFATPISFAHSGTIRQESAMNGVDAVPSEFELIAVHDGARPLVTPERVSRAINILKGDYDYDGVVVGHPAIDTLKVAEDRVIVGTPDRNMFWLAQTPQVFRSNVCRRAYSTAMFDGFVGTDDSSLVERMGARIYMLQGPRDNVKITVPEDVAPAAATLFAHLAAMRKQ